MAPKPDLDDCFLVTAAPEAHHNATPCGLQHRQYSRLRSDPGTASLLAAGFVRCECAEIELRASEEKLRFIVFVNVTTRKKECATKIVFASIWTLSE